jgi:membrane-bound lytic murein transglycosylase D
MHKILILIGVLSATTIQASGHTAPLQDLMASSAPATVANGSPTAEGPALNGGGNEAGLPASDFFTLSAPENPLAEIELKLPVTELPESDIPLTINKKVEYFIKLYRTNGREAFGRWLSRSERYIPMMKVVLKQQGLPEDLVYLAMIESGFSPDAYSVARAAGPWQFMPDTAKGFSLKINPWIDERRDPLKSTVAAAIYLKELYNLFNKDWYLAAAGYNAGEHKILRAINKYNSRDYWELSRGSFLKRETKDYVPRLLAAAIIAKDPVRYGFADVAYLPPIEFDSVTIPAKTDLELVATICGVPHETIRQLNPELLMWCTPPDYPNYELKIPKGMKELFLTEYAKVPEEKRFTEKVIYTRYRAKRGDTLTSVARRFGSTTNVIADLNNLGRHRKLAGRTLLVPVQVDTLEPTSAARVADNSDLASANKGFTKFYTVKKGDTLDKVAKRFNISTRVLAAWNNLKGKVALKPGRRIIVAKYVEKKGALVYEREDS